jgi:hypothetical protein
MKNRYFERIADLVLTLDDNGVPSHVENLYDGYKVTFSWTFGTVVAHSGVLGRNASKYTVESSGFPWDEDDVTLLDVQDAIDLITEYYKA